MFGFPLAFLAPVLLSALVALPVLYWLLRLTPPAPKRVALPTLPLVRDLIPDQQTPARTPWWLLLMRLLIAAAIIIAMAGPIWNPRPGALDGKGPLLVLIDGGWASAPEWKLEMDRALFLAATAQSEGRPVAVKSLAEAPSELVWATGRDAEQRLRALRPAPHTIDRAQHLASIGTLLKGSADADVEWISDRVTLDKNDGFAGELAKLANGHAIVHAEPSPLNLAVTGAVNQPDGLVVKVLRASTSAKGSATLRALDSRGRLLGETRVDFGDGALETSAKFDLPLELRNEVSRVEITGEGSAGAVTLLDANDRRRRVGLVSGESTDTAQPLLSAAYYVAKALAPYAELRQPPRGAAEGLTRVTEDGASVIVLTDVGTLTGPALERATAFVENGGVLVRFASTQATAPTDDLVPVRLRRSGRTLGSTLSWEKPQKLAPFTETSPFFGLSVPEDVTVNRQLLAEPDATLSQKSWAQLQDGTPLVTGAKRGKGLIALIHVPPDLAWSNLALSGLFVDMLRKLVQLSPSGVDVGDTDDAGPRIAPLRTLDGTGAFTTPPVTAKPISATRRAPATLDNPPGFYGPPEALVAVNTLGPQAQLQTLDLAGLAMRPLIEEKPLDLRPAMLSLAFILFLADAFAVLLLSGAFRRLRYGVTTALLLIALLPALSPKPAHAQAAPQPSQPDTALQVRPDDLRSALTTRLAYVVTGDREVDETSRLGLLTLTRALASRTAFEPGDPIGIDLTRDEVVFYPLIYWPIVASRPAPARAAIERIDTFMRNGGIVVFDTRDALNDRGGPEPTPETRRLREILAAIEVPELEPVPRDHVITKAFYLVDNFVGRYNTGKTWIEALPPEGQEQKDRPARGGDRVSPIILSSNDLAAAWAVDRNGQPRHALMGSDPRQREMALRGGVNIVMYAMTGNYKSDQVHVPALLERLGN